MVTLGMFALNPVGMTGSIIQQLNHGISTGALFLIVGIVYERRHTREISEYGGLSKVMPVYAAVFMIMTMSSIGLPTLNGFIGEFLILQGAFTANIWWAVAAGSGVVLGAAYMLWLYQRTMFGKIENPKNENLPDLNVREFMTFAPLIILAVWIGIYPTPFLERLDPTVKTVIARLNKAYSAPALAKATTPKDCGDAPAAKPANPFVSMAPCDPGTEGTAKPVTKPPATLGEPKASGPALGERARGSESKGESKEPALSESAKGSESKGPTGGRD